MRLKHLRRQGWLDRGVEDPESGADHSWGVALLAWSLAHGRDDLDRDRVLLLALLHDLPEALAGDLTPFDVDRDAAGRIPAERFSSMPLYSGDVRRQKQEREAEALEEMIAGLPADLADEIRSAWREYEADSTPEARFVKQVDKLETLIQAEAYRSRQPELVVQSFWLGSRQSVTDADLAAIIDELERQQTQ